jgi:predicted permease
VPIILIFGGLAFAVVAAFLIFVGFIGEDLTSQGWKLVAICGGLSLVLLAGGALLLRSERYRSRS